MPLGNNDILEYPQIVGTVSDYKSTRFAYKIALQQPLTMPRPPGTPRPPLGDVSPNTGSRIVGSRDHGVKFGAIGAWKTSKIPLVGRSTKTRLTRLLASLTNATVDLQSLLLGTTIDSARNCAKTEDYCQTTLLRLRSSLFQRDSLLIPQKWGVAVQEKAILDRRTRAITPRMGFKVRWNTLSLLETLKME